MKPCFVTTSPRPKLGGSTRQERPIARIITFITIVAVAAGAAISTSPTPAEPKAQSRLLGIGSAAHADAHTACDRRALNRAIAFHRQHYRTHREAMWEAGPVPRVRYRDCVARNRRAVDWRDKADVARIELVEWRVYHYAWQDWFPRGWYRVGSCETGYGGPPNWRHWNSSYEGAFGFATGTWDGYVGEAERRFGHGPDPVERRAGDTTPAVQRRARRVRALRPVGLGLPGGLLRLLSHDHARRGDRRAPADARVRAVLRGPRLAVLDRGRGRTTRRSPRRCTSTPGSGSRRPASSCARRARSTAGRCSSTHPDAKTYRDLVAEKGMPGGPRRPTTRCTTG